MSDPTTAAPEPRRFSSGYSRKNPILAEFDAHERLTLDGSEKETRHFVLSSERAGWAILRGIRWGHSGGTHRRWWTKSSGCWVSNAKLRSKIRKANRRRSGKRCSRLCAESREPKNHGRLSERIPQGEQRNRLMEIVDNSEVLSEYI